MFPQAIPVRESQAAQAWKRFRRHRTAMWGLAVVAVLTVSACCGPWLAPYVHNTRHELFLAPSAQHWLGTDANGYDVLSRVMYGARLTLFSAGLSIGCALVFGGILGAVAGYCGGVGDALLMRAIDVLLAFPGILIGFLLATAYEPGTVAVVAAVALLNIPLVARQIRATVLTVRELDYVLAARALGGSSGYILRRAILPSLVNPMVVLATLGLGNAVLEVAGFAFLGINGDIGQAEWGSMLQEARPHLSRSLWPVIGAGGAISLTVISFNLVGDGLRDVLDIKRDRSWPDARRFGRGEEA